MAEFVGLLNLNVFDAPHLVMVFAALVMILIDILTGIFKGVKTGTLNSTKMRSGLWNKLAFIMAMVLAMVCELFINVVDMGVDIPLTGFVCAYIVVTEIVSIMENLSTINPELCKLFNKFLESAKKEQD